MSRAEDIPGIVNAKPADGLSVQTEKGWMVPYDVTIPNTDVTFRMIPVPPGEFLMGSPSSEEGREDIEGPQRRVAVQPF